MQKNLEKQLAIPCPGKRPTFEEIAGIVHVGALYELSACVLCLTQSALEKWQARLETFPARLPRPRVLDANQVTLEDWRMILRQEDFNIIVLQDVKTRLDQKQLSVRYLQILVEVVPAGLVMVF